MTTYNTNLADALEHLNSLISSGIEYPEAIYKTTTAFDVNHQDLQDDYDRQFMIGGRA